MLKNQAGIDSNVDVQFRLITGPIMSKFHSSNVSRFCNRNHVNVILEQKISAQTENYWQDSRFLCCVSTFSESVVILMDGFLAVTAVLEPHRLFLPAAVPVSGSPAPPSVVAGDVLLPAGVKKKKK